MMSIKGFVSSILIVLLVMPSVAFADDQPAADVAIITKQGTPVPFPGVLYSFPADARIRTEKEQAQARFDDKLRLELGLQDARLRLSTATTANALEALQKSSTERLGLKDERIKQLEKKLEESNGSLSNLEKIGWMSAGVVLVLISAVSIHLAATGHLTSN